MCELVPFQSYYYYCIDNTKILTGRTWSILNILDNLADINSHGRSFNHDVLCKSIRHDQKSRQIAKISTCDNFY